MSRILNSHRVVTMVSRIIRQIRNDRRTLGLMIVAPMLATLVYAVMFTETVTDVPTALCVDDIPWELKIGDAIVEQLEQSENVTVFRRDQTTAFDGLGTSIHAVLLIPMNLTECLLTAKDTVLELFVNVTTTPHANFIRSLIANASVDAVTESLGRTGLKIDPHITVRSPSPPVSGDLSFNLSLVNADIGLPISIGDMIQDLLSRDNNVSLVSYSSLQEVIQSVENRECVVGIYIPADFTKILFINGTSKLEVFVNAIEPSEVSTALSSVRTALGDALRLSLDRGTDLQLTYIYGTAGMSMIELAGPSVIGFLALFFGFIISGVFFLRERQQGTLERLRASPLTDIEVVFGYTIAFIVVSLVQTTIICMVIVYFSSTILTTIWLLVPLVLLLVIGSVTLAMAASYRMKTELQVIQMIPLFIIPQIFLCGIFFPISLLPSYLVFLPYLFPLTYYVMAVKSVTFFGGTIFDIIVPLIVLALYSILGIVAAIAGRSKK